MKLLINSLRIVTGLVFLFSAYVKLFPIELFEVAAVETGMVGWKLAPFAARFIIGFEFFLGLMLVFGLYRKHFLRLALVTLGVFSIHLFFQLLNDGNNSNCNCFGLAWAMTPAESLVKNILLAAAAFFVLFKSEKQQNKKRRIYITIFLGLISLGITFLLAPVYVGYSGNNPEKTGYRLELELILNDSEADQPEIDLFVGKQILVFMSASCHHCVVTGYKFSVMKERYPQIPVFFFINGDDDDISDFHFKTKSSEIPWAGISAPTIIRLAGTNLPVIMWLEDGIVVRKTSYIEVDENDIIHWIESTQ